MKSWTLYSIKDNCGDICITRAQSYQADKLNEAESRYLIAPAPAGAIK